MRPSPSIQHVVIGSLLLLLPLARPFARAQPQPYEPQARADATSAALESSDKFVLLANGHQIKLYPFVASAQSGPAPGETLLETHFHPVRSLAERAWSAGQLGSLPAASAFRRRLAELRHDQSDRGGRQRFAEATRFAMEPALGPSASATAGWQQPWITDVDFFLDPAYCALQPHQQRQQHACLVVVWLDERNNIIRYGSSRFNLSVLAQARPVEAKQVARRHRGPAPRPDPTIWLDEFPPVEFRADQQLMGMALERRSGLIHVALGQRPPSKGSSSPLGHQQSISQAGHPSEFVSGKLWPTWTRPNGTANALQGQCVTGLRLDCGRRVAANRRFRSFHLLEPASSNWFAYLDETADGREELGALRLDSCGPSRAKQSGTPMRSSILHLEPGPADAQQPHHQTRHSHASLRPNASAMVVDPANNRFVWLNDLNEVRTCDLAGAQQQLVAALPARPKLGAAHTLQIHNNDLLYISDPLRGSLAVYQLPPSAGPRPSASAAQTSHRIMLVETPTLLGFRILQLAQHAAHIRAQLAPSGASEADPEVALDLPTGDHAHLAVYELRGSGPNDTCAPSSPLALRFVSEARMAHWLAALAMLEALLVLMVALLIYFKYNWVTHKLKFLCSDDFVAEEECEEIKCPV